MTPAARRIASIAAALVLAFGVLALGWPSYWVLALYWLENVVIGFATLARLVFAGIRTGQPLGALGTSLFFCVHYGLFCAVHGFFVAALFGGRQQGDMQATLSRMVGDVFRDLTGVIAFASIGVAVLVDLVQWIAEHRDDEDRALVAQTMAAPYGRIVVLHVVLLVGGFLMQLFGAPAAAVLLLIAMKLAVDLGALRLGRGAPRRGPTTPGTAA